MSQQPAPVSDHDIDLPDVRSEVAAVFARYEQALVANDVATLDELFWPDERTVRFGLSDHQHGFAEIAAHRRSAAPPPPRRLFDTTVTTFGRAFAVVTTKFQPASETRIGRQSQTWACVDGHWRVVSAHVSWSG
jgi:hypothetical protein